MADKQPLTPYLFAVTKAMMLCDPKAEEWSYLTHAFTKACHSQGLLTVEVERRVLRQDITSGAYRLLCFDDETAVLVGPEGSTEAVSVEVHRGGDFEGEAHPGYVTIERWTNTPAWVTSDVIDGLERESIG